MSVSSQSRVDARLALLTFEGEEILNRGAVSHNHLFFYRFAMRTALDKSEWEEAERYAALLEAFTEAEPLPDQLAAFGISGKSGGFSRLFMTHPPLEERIAALKQL